jgi:hypothetical protein
VKKLLSIFLLICLFLQVAGFYFVFLVRRQSIKQEVKAFLRSHRQREEQHVFRISITGNEPGDPVIQWEEADEFSFNDTMFDVIDMKQVAGFWEILAISDEKETDLIKDFEKNLSANTTHKNPGKTGGLIKLITAPFITNSIIAVPLTDVQLSVYDDSFSLYLPTVIFEIPTPPPQIG